MTAFPDSLRGKAWRWIARLAVALALAALLLAAFAGLVRQQLAELAQGAQQRSLLAASSVAAALDASLARFVEQAQGMRPVDFGPDRVTQTTRMLRWQTLLPPNAAAFMLSPDGQLFAASAPFQRQDASVSGQAWFRQAQASERLNLQTLERPWLGVADGLVVARAVTDNGKPVGVVGAVLPQSALATLLSPDWLPPGAAVALNKPGLTTSVPSAGQDDGLAASVLRWVGQPAKWKTFVPLQGIDAEVAVTGSALSPVQELLGSPALIGSGLALLLAWLLGTAALFRSGRAGAAQPVGFGADWRCQLDRAGRVRRAHGALPDSVRRGETLPAPQIMAAVAARASITLRQTLGGRTYDLALTPASSGFTCTGRDVTVETAALAAAEAAETAAAETRRQQDGLLASLGHDIRTPMASIMASCELLLDGELEEEQRVWLERMQASCGALLGMLNGLLAAAGETGGGTLVREPVDVGALLQEVARLLRPQAHDKGLELRTRCDDLLRGQWLLDPARLRQVVFNLAVNAVKFTAAGRVDISASVVEADGQSRLRIAVADTGPGIDPTDRERIFERFERGRGSETAGGLGLGLALCRENAVLMGGTLALESALGVGSEFTFDCPVERAPAQDRLRPFVGRTALIVAADESATRAIAGQLSELGLTVELAPDGYLGLALAERLDAQCGAVDLVLLQSGLPGMRGEAFVLRLRATAFGRRAALVWLGSDKAPDTVDASLPAPDPYQVAAVVKQLLNERPSFAVLEPDLARSRGGRVLLAEDDKANQALLAAALKKRGFAVFTAGNGAEAVRLTGHGTFDAILMDLQMPEMDGFEAVRRIRALPGQAGAVPILALTAMQGALVRRRCAEAGFTAVLDKPVNLERLVSELRACIGGEAASAEAADPAEFVADVSSPFLEEMIAVVGLERARACVAEFVADATKRCRRLGELLPGWELEAILRSCEEISGMAETCGALALGELLEEIADAANRDDRPAAEALIARLDTVVARLPLAMAACLDDVARRWRGDRAA